MGYNLKDSSPCASIIGGIGNVCGRPVMILAHVPTQSGGAWNEFTGQPFLWTHDSAHFTVDTDE